MSRTEKFEDVLGRFDAKRLSEMDAAVLDGDVIAIDGKSLRRSFADAAACSPVPPMQAFAVQPVLCCFRTGRDPEREGDIA